MGKWLHDRLAPVFGWRTLAQEAAYERKHEAWCDQKIAEYEMHVFNEDTVLPGDPPYYDVCDEVGDGHYHYPPPTMLPRHFEPQTPTPPSG